MKKINTTEAIFQKIASGIKVLNPKKVNEVKPKINQPQKNMSVYDTIIDTIKTDTKGDNINDNKQQ